MPSDSTMSKATSLFFAVRCYFSLRGAFCHTDVHTMRSSWTYHGPPLSTIHLCSPRKVSIGRDGFHLLRKLSVVATLITKVLFKQLLIRTAAKQIEHSW